MREYISKKIENMSNLDEKGTLRAALEQVFLPLYDETVRKYEELEHRVNSELVGRPKEYAVYSTLLPKEKANGYASWLTPVIETDQRFILTNDKEPVLDTVFIEADWLVCKEILDNNETFKGSLMVDGNTYEIEVKLRASEVYKGKIAELYSHFINNGIPWATLNVPFIFKMFDVVITNLHELNKEVLAKNTNYDWEIPFGKHDKYIKKNLIPVWNVSSFEAKGDGFPVPIIDKKNYEYSFYLEDYGAEDGFLADYERAPIIHTRRDQNTYIVAVSEKKEFAWRMIHFAKPIYMGTLSFPYPVMSNIQEDQFASRMISYYGCKVNTKAEIVRLIYSFEVSNYLKFENLRVLANRSMKNEGYEANFFIEDEIRDGNISKTLLLQFSKNNNNNIYLMRDAMSFIVSQIQLVYPEYNCVGALL